MRFLLVRRGLLALTLALPSFACGTIEYRVNATKPVLLGPPHSPDFQVLRHVEDEGKKLWLFWWLVPVGNERDSTLEQFATSGGDAVANVTIHESYDFIDFLVQNWSSLIGLPGITNTLNEDFAADLVRYVETGA